MGYILPVNSYTYSNYHKRLLNRRNNSYHIGRKHQVTFQEILRDADSEAYSLTQHYMENYNVSGEMEKVTKGTNGMRSVGKGENVNMTI